MLNSAPKPLGITSRKKMGGVDGVNEYLIAQYSFGGANDYEI